MVTGQKPLIGVVAPNPGIASEIEGAPVSTPGGNDGKDKTTMTGTPATVAASTDTEAPAPVSLSPEEQAKADAVAGTDRQIKTIQDWMDAEENRPETPEERKKRERKEKSKKIIAAVSDGISALSNLFFTSQYAPNMYNHEKGSQLNATNERIERLKAEREKKRDEYLNFALKLGGLENERARTLRELEAQQEKLRIARKAAEHEEEKHNWEKVLQADKQREQSGKADKVAAEAETARVEAGYAPRMQEAKLDTERARAGAQRASAANSYASASAHNRSNLKEFYGTGKDGKEYPFATEKSAIDFEHRQGTYNPSKWGHDVIEETTVTGRENTAKGKTTTKKKVYPEKKADPTADDKDDPTA